MAKTQENRFSPKMLAAMARFDTAYAEWLAARADLAARHENETDEEAQRRGDREDAAALALATTPAPHSTAVWNKWNFLEHYVAGEVEDGPSVPNYGRRAGKLAGRHNNPRPQAVAGRLRRAANRTVTQATVGRRRFCDLRVTPKARFSSPRIRRLTRPADPPRRGFSSGAAVSLRSSSK
jgi:hypothetical protein